MKTQTNTQSQKRAKKTATQRPNKSRPRTATKTTSKPKTATLPNATDRAVRASTKVTAVIEILKRPGGATINDISKATGWLPHTVRGLLSGTIKKKRGLKLTSDKIDGVRVYRIEV